MLHAADPRHFWYRARHRTIELIVRRLVAGLPPGYTVLDAGCGVGGVLPALRAACPGGRVIGMDQFDEGLRHAREHGPGALVRGAIERPPFKRPFTVVGLFDVLEHMPDDVGTLRTMRALIAPGGALVITVPAGPDLWSYADDAARHQRRYTRDELADKLRRAGYAIEQLTPYMAALLLPLRLGRAVLSRGREDDARRRLARELRVIPVVNEVMTAVLLAEARWVARRRALPFGASLLAVARRG